MLDGVFAERLVWKKASVCDCCVHCPGVLLQLSLAGCDGGQKDGSSGPENILGNNWTNTRCKSLTSGLTQGQITATRKVKHKHL